jgi:hypothetical protein
MKYAVKHMYGISANHDTSSLAEPLFGTGQGSGASPAIWLSLVVILLNSLDCMSKEDNIPALSFSDPWKEILAEWRVGAFVDDTNQGVVDPTGDLSAEDLVEQLRQAGQMWERLLHNLWRQSEPVKMLVDHAILDVEKRSSLSSTLIFK